MAESAVSYLLPKLGSLIANEARFLLGVEEQVTSIRDELQWIRSFLRDADRKRNRFERVDVWVSQIRDLAYEAEDVIDVFVSKLELQRQRNIILRFIYYRDQLITLHKLGEQIKNVNRKLENISTYKSRYNLEELLPEETWSHSIGFLELKENTLFNDDDVGVVGFEDEAKKLSKLLTKEPKQLLIISIVAMGGIGKTTLAKKVYKDVEKEFDCCSFVYISQKYKVRDLLLATAKQLITKKNKDELEIMKDDDLKTELKEYLEGKKVLMVLDDLWRTNDWDALEANLLIKGNNTKITVLITSRNKEVAIRANQSIKIHEDDKSSCIIHDLLLLNPEECWELFLKKVFVVTSAKKNHPEELNLNSSAETSYSKESHPKELENLPFSAEKNNCKDFEILERNLTEEMKELGKKIVAKCGGLPLAIVVLGGLLSRKEKTYAEWSKVLESVNWRLNQEGAQCLQALGLSYTDLPHYLKSCFLYFGLFPEDYEIDADRLIRLWIAEGFIQERGEETLEDVAAECIQELSQRSMIQVVRGEGGRVERCRIHDLLRDVAISEAKRDKFLAICGKNHYASPKKDNPSRRVSIQIEIGKYHSTTIGLHSFLCFTEKLETSFTRQHTRLLRVLDLENVKSIKRLPMEIGQLILLKYLSLRRTWVKKLPSSIKNLLHLQTLDLYYSAIKDLPSQVWEMQQLRHVYFSGSVVADGKVRLVPPQKICGLRNVHTLCLNAGNWIEGCLDKLINLRILMIEGDSLPYAEEIANAIVKLVCLRELQIHTHHSLFGHPRDQPAPFPHISLSAHVQLYKLILYIPLRKLPLPHDVPASLTELKLSYGTESPEDDPMEPLEKLPNLKVLYIRNFVARKMTCSKGGFLQLRTFEMYLFPYLKEWMVEEGAFPNLRVLNIGSCDQLEVLPEGFRHVRTLKELVFFHMPTRFTDWVHKKTGEEWEKFQHIPTIMDRDPIDLL